VRADGEHATTEQQTLALYLLGALDPAETESFEEHLAGCWRCLNEAAQVGPATGGLAGLGEADWSDLDPLPGATPAQATSTSPARSAAPVAPGPVAPDGPRPAGTRVDAARPAGARPAPARPGPNRRRRTILTGVAGAFIAVALAGGVVAVAHEYGGRPTVLTATGQAAGNGASLSVTITTDKQGSTTIEIVVTGLDPGLRYRLYAVTSDGTPHTVRDWTASTGSQRVTGQTTVRADDLSFITVGLPDGPAVVTAPVLRGPATPH